MRPSEPSGARAKLFWNGRSQAVRLPKEFRFEGDEVSIRKEGDAVVLEPIAQRGWPPGFWEWVDEHREDDDLDLVEPLDIHLLDPDGDEGPR